MEILVIDDQELVRMSVEKYLNGLGHDTFAVENGLEGLQILEGYKPDLIILDINMPGMSGLEMLCRLRDSATPHTPIMILSGNASDSVIMQAFRLGVVDYMKKPVTLAELGARVARIVGNPKVQAIPRSKGTPVVQEHGVGVVIPCYNEVNRINPAHFQKFLDQNLGYRLCFVNDGSTDETLKLLKRLRKGYEERVQIYNLKNNVGKAEAVRRGMLYTAANSQVDYVGYLDADLSTDFEDFDTLVQTLKSSNYAIVSGSRIQRMGANISKESARAIISKTINYLIRQMLGMPFKDTQCGAKVMPRERVLPLFKDSFSTRWLFDVELFLRLRQKHGRDKAVALVCEVPLKRWIHADGSKLGLKDSLKIGGQLLKLFKRYILTNPEKAEKGNTQFPNNTTESDSKQSKVATVPSAA